MLSSAAVSFIVTVASALAGSTFAPFGSLPLAVTLFSTLPASKSACVTVYVYVIVLLPPGVSENPASLRVTRVSSSLMVFKDTLPLFVTTTVYVTSVPTAAFSLGLAVFVTVISGSMVTVLTVSVAS